MGKGFFCDAEWLLLIQDIKVQDIWVFFVARLYRCKNLRSSYFTYWLQYPHLSIMDLRALCEIMANSVVDAIIDILVSCSQATDREDYYWWQPHTVARILKVDFLDFTICTICKHWLCLWITNLHAFQQYLEDLFETTNRCWHW